MNIAEIELNITIRQCLSRRLDYVSMVEKQLETLEKARIEECKKLTRQFTTSQARKNSSLFILNSENPGNKPP